jgi:hypothetical protein
MTLFIHDKSAASGGVYPRRDRGFDPRRQVDQARSLAMALADEKDGGVYPRRSYRSQPAPPASRRVYPGGLPLTGEKHGGDKPRRSPRNGISLFEVLVAMLVALIGVFGVFALIAFAVRQTEIGMNEEAAVTMGRNGTSAFEAHGFQEVILNPFGPLGTPQRELRWAVPDLTTAGPAFYTAVPLDETSDQFYCIDPWGLSQFLQPGDDPASPPTPLPTGIGSFPFFNPLPAGFPVMPRITLYDRSAISNDNVLSRSLARRLFSGHDDLVLTEPVDDFSGPTQEFFLPDGGRQYSGRLSWQMFVARHENIDDYARFFAAVSLDRVADIQDRIFEVSQTGNPGTRLAGPTTLLGGGDVTLREVTGTQPLDSTLIRRGLWMMLIVHPSATPDIQEFAFYRVLESDLTTAPGTTPRDYQVTLQGSDLFVPTGSNVSAVLLPNVISVYERTMKFEPTSDWNVQ